MNHVENMKTILELFKNKGITLFMDGEKLKYRASHGINHDDILLLKENKEALIQYLKEHTEDIRIISAPEDMYKPFALTDVQAAYALGRKDTFEYGGVACHVYMELTYSELHVDKVQAAWQRLIARHEMLRAIVNENGTQQVLPEVNEFKIQEYDLLHIFEAGKALEKIRNRMGNAVYELGSWPMFEIAVSHTDKESILHFSMEFLIADWKSIWMLLYEFETLYFTPEQLLPEVGVTFRDYLIAERKLKETEQYKVDKEYWLNRIESLPKAPELPILRNPIKNRSDFSRYFMEIDQEKWNRLKRYSNHFGITPTAVVLTAYAEVIERWSQTSEFCINLTVLNRAPIHQKVEEIVGDFTSVNLLETRMEKSKPFIDKAREISGQLFEDLDHRLFNGVEVIREISRKKGREHSLMPIVFTSAIGLSDKKLQGEFHGNGISQTPQVFIDCQVMDGEYGLQADWDVRNGVFPDGLIKDMFETFRSRLLELAETDVNWTKVSELELPSWQLERIAGINSTEKEISPQMLYDEFLEQVKKQPAKVAVIDSADKFTYLELHHMALGIADRLSEMGIKPGSNIAVLLPKSRFQVAAVLGILYASCVYVPVDIEQPEQCWNTIVANADIKAVLIHSGHSAVFEHVPVLPVDQIEAISNDSMILRGTPDDLAYIIFTSGTTGVPKGVAITHKAAWNTIKDINQKFFVSSQDSVLGLSKLNFDLSVYDIFGLLSCGGTLVYPKLSRYIDPSHWVELIQEYEITIWNSVPAFMQILTGYFAGKSEKLPLRIVLLSGDWIPVGMPGDIQKCAGDAMVISLGGATEASIWSIYHECVDNEICEVSIPYGKPLSNQGFSIYDAKGRPCPVYVTGELCIWGTGLAEGYYNDHKLTEAKFVTGRENGRMYKTGDIGCYLPNGEIEFKGRNDNQIKLRGHRIELGEIQSTLEQHKSVSQAMVVLNEVKTDIYAFVKTVQGNVKNSDLKQYLEAYLPKYMIPADIISVEEFPLTANGKIDRDKIKKLIIKQENAEGKEMREENPDELQNKLIELWNSVVPQSAAGVFDNFYDLGADSLILAQMATKVREQISKDIAFDALLRELIYNPTIQKLSEFIRNNTETEVEEKKMEDTNSELVFVREYGGDLEKGLSIIFHGALGSFNRFDYLADSLIASKGEKVIGIGIKDTNKYCSIPSTNLIWMLSDIYSQIISSYQVKAVSLIGYCFGGVIALETANRLNENSITVKSLSILDSLLLPPSFKVEDELLMEMMFLDNIPVSYADIEMPNPALYEQIIVQESMKKGVINKGFLTSISGTTEREQLGGFFRELATMLKEERFGLYAAQCKKNTNVEMPMELIKSLYQVCVATFEAMHYELCPYLGTIDYYFAREGEVGFKKMVLETWEGLALGTFNVIEIPGNHYTCVEQKKNAEYLAGLLCELKE